MATPVYIREITTLLRAFVERTYSFYLPDFHTNPKPSRLKPGKKLVFVQVQGQADDKLFADIFPRIEPLFKRYGYAVMHVARICGVRNPGEAEGRNDALNLMENIGREAYQGSLSRLPQDPPLPLVSYKITFFPD